MNNIEIKESIVYFLDKKKKYKKEQIVKYIGKNIDKELEELELEGLIYIDNHELYSSFPEYLVQGIITINKKDAILKSNKKRYKIKHEDLSEVLDKDIVIIKPTDEFDSGLPVAKIIKILKRKTGNLIVEVKERNGIKYLEDIDKRFTTPIELPNHVLKEFNYGDRLLVNIGLPSDQNFYKAELITFISNKNDPDKEIKTSLVNNGFTLGFSNKSLEEIRNIPKTITKEQMVGRVDFRDIPTISIDGKYTKDRDDAYSIRILPNGNYQLIIHISDVSEYVKPGMALWDEAMEKGTSVYPLDYVEPMLPKELSNGICSLDENEERLTESSIIEIDKEGNIIDFKTVSGIIKSNKQCTYEDVNKILEEFEMVEGYEEIYQTLLISKELSTLLKNRMLKKGFLNFLSNDIETTRKDNGELDTVNEKKMGTSEEIIEFFMVFTDELAALESILPMIYRTHEEPVIEKVKNIIDYIRSCGVNIKFNTKANTITSKHIQHLLAQIKGNTQEDIISSYLIQSMKRARYSSINIGHFALGLPAYIQITSPIRRAGDLWNQYYRKLQREGYHFTNKELNELYKKSYELSEHLTYKELQAEKVCKECFDLAASRYYINNPVNTIPARITYISRSHILIKTDKGVKGQLSLTKNYVFIKDKNTYYNKDKNLALTLGNNIEVTLDKVYNDNSLVFKLK